MTRRCDSSTFSSVKTHSRVPTILFSTYNGKSKYLNTVLDQSCITINTKTEIITNDAPILFIKKFKPDIWDISTTERQKRSHQNVQCTNETPMSNNSIFAQLITICKTLDAGLKALDIEAICFYRWCQLGWKAPSEPWWSPLKRRRCIIRGKVVLTYAR